MSRLSTSALLGGVGAGALWFRERAARRSAERLAAATLETLLNAVDANDAVTGAHLRRTAAYALVLAHAAGVSTACRRSVERVALFHDIGKIHEALFDIVHADKKLSPEERSEVSTHPQRGAEVLAPLAAFYPELPEGVLSHHERWDGTGYPRKLRGAQIPLEARIVAIADTFDALTHSRRYHEGEGLERATNVVRDERGAQFDPELADLFLMPAVLQRVREQMRLTQPIAPAPSTERRTAEVESDVPDVRFRWRPPQPADEASR
jgi:putative two-component system response regulator